VRRAVLVFPEVATRMLSIASELGFETALLPSDASQLHASKALQV
jgi:hypothetical protein